MTSPPLGDVIALLDAAGVAYMLVGSFASSVHGPPRSTQDIDIVIELGTDQVPRLLAAVDRERFYVADEQARAAADNRDQFNLIDGATGWKVDLIVRKDRPFSVEEFARRELIEIEGRSVWVASSEDTVLAKLEWAMIGGSERQLADAASVLAFAGNRIDDDYLDRWALELGSRRCSLVPERRRRVRLVTDNVPI